MQLDPEQLLVKRQLIQIAAKLETPSKWQKLLAKFSHTAVNNVYLHGPVGRGKTMLLEIFYQQAQVPKKLIHFQQFMQQLHQNIHQQPDKDTTVIINNIASELATQYQLLCIDELEIKDIADSLLIKRLVEALVKQQVNIALTTNIAPKDLYKNGLQYNSFAPFIHFINQHFVVLNLDGGQDYRSLFNAEYAYDKIQYNPDNMQLKQAWNQLVENKKPTNCAVSLFERTVNFSCATATELYTNFAELFEQPLGYSDYVAICSQFKVIMIEQVRAIDELEIDIITRFINFIDSAYFNKVLVFMQCLVPIEQLYPKNAKATEFARCLSRMREMNTLAI